MLKRIGLSCAVIICSIVIVVWIIIVCCVFSTNGYTIAFNGEIESDVTQAFVSLISLVVVPVVSLLAVIIYKRALEEQMSSSRHDIFFRMLQRQDSIKGQLYIRPKILINNKETPIETELSSHRYFEYVYWADYYLNEAILKKIKCENDWGFYESSYDSAVAKYDEVDWHENSQWCEQRIQKKFERLKCLYLACLYKSVLDSKEYTNSFAIIYNSLKKYHYTYFSHIENIIRYITTCTTDDNESHFYIQYMCSSLSRYELHAVKRYFKYVCKNEKRDFYYNILKTEDL